MSRVWWSTGKIPNFHNPTNFRAETREVARSWWTRYLAELRMLELEGKEKVKFFDIVVGHVTTPAYSRRLGKSLALVHLVPSAAVEGTALELKGPTIQCRATAASIPFVDPQRKRLHAM